MRDPVPRGPSAAAAVAAALFAPTVIFISAANNVILRNLSELPYAAETTLWFVGAFACGFAVVLPIFVMARRWRSLAFAARAVVAIGVTVVLCDVGGAIAATRVERLAVQIVVDLVVATAAVLIVWAPKFSTFLPVFGVVGAVLLAHGVVQHGRALWEMSRARERLSAERAHYRALAPTMTADLTRGNIYHIVLDGFQSEAFDVLRARDGTAQLEGFTYFPRFRVGYYLTMYSLPQVLTGRAYEEGESLLEWQRRGFAKGVWGDLVAGAASVYLYPFLDSHCSPVTDHCRSVQVAMTEMTSRPAGEVIVDMWFLGLLPASLRATLADRVRDGKIVREKGAGIAGHDSLEGGFSLTARWRSDRARDRAKLAMVPWVEQWPVASVANFSRMLEDEARRPGGGSYVFAHLFVPHRPYVLNEECKYSGKRRDLEHEDDAAETVAGYLSQAACGLHLIGRLVDRLKMLGRLEDALIIVHADHGMFPEGGRFLAAQYPESMQVEWGDSDDDRGGWRQSETVGLRSHALLLARFPGASAFRTAAQAAQAIDLAPTILHHVGLPLAQYPGVALQEMPEALEREIAFFAGEPTSEFFERLLDSTDELARPSGGHFSKFVLDGRQWRYQRDISVR